MNVWSWRGSLSLATDVDAAVDQIGVSAVAFVVAVGAIQVTQGVWSMVAAWNARRCTIAAPSVVGMLALFLAGPAMFAYGMLITDDRGARLTLVGIALLLNLACWALSFSVIATTLDVLGRSSDLIARWGVTVSLHWVLIFMFRPLDRLDSDTIYAGVVVVLALIDAAIFAAASLAAWRAMQHFDAATGEYRLARSLTVDEDHHPFVSQRLVDVAGCGTNRRGRSIGQREDHFTATLPRHGYSFPAPRRIRPQVPELLGAAGDGHRHVQAVHGHARHDPR